MAWADLVPITADYVGIARFNTSDSLSGEPDHERFHPDVIAQARHRVEEWVEIDVSPLVNSFETTHAFLDQALAVESIVPRLRRLLALALIEILFFDDLKGADDWDRLQMFIRDARLAFMGVAARAVDKDDEDFSPGLRQRATYTYPTFPG